MEEEFTLNKQTLPDNGIMLVVEDDTEILHLIEIILKREGIKFISAHSYKESIEIFNHNNIRSVITDVVLPDGSGIAIAREIHDKYPDMPFLFPTGISDAGTCNLLWQHGMVYNKPIQEDFPAAVRRLIMCANSDSGVFGKKCDKDKDRRCKYRRTEDIENNK